MTSFHTHTSKHAERLHRISEFIMLPARWCGQLLAHIVEPNPGAHKDNLLRNIFIRIGAFIGFLLLVPFGLPSLMIGFPLRIIDHFFRPKISFLNRKNANLQNKPALTQEKPLHIRTHNIGFVPSTMGIVGDLRDAKIRAKELTKRINEDTCAPDVICFQETFNEDATRILCKGLQMQYPYIIHSVAPQINGFSSGAMIASKYPLLDADFEQFNHMVGPERLAPRGILKVRLATEQGDVLLYNIHTQSLLGEDRAQARLKQLQRVHQLMEADLRAEPNIHQVVVGDFNASRVTAWGEDNLEPPGQAEEPVLNFLKESFNDPFLDDHDPLTGKRTKDTPLFLEADRKAQKITDLNEPSASWYHGPFADRGVFLSAKMRRDRKKHHQPEPKAAAGISLAKTKWGTVKWQEEQTANTARFDYILFLKTSSLHARAEIRNIGGNAYSASSDHLPVDAKLWREEGQVLIEGIKT